MTALSLNYEQITRNVIVDGNDDSPYYDGSISLCNCHNHPPPQTCTTEICFNYATLTECLQCSSTHCQNNKFTQLYSKKLEVRPVEHKGHGLFCLEDIERGGDFIREYVGELITTKEFVKRMKAPDISTHLYIMELKPNTFLDARRKGSVSRFINHSCEPNCTVEVWTVGKRLRVGIFSLKAIPAGSELTFDYRWERSVRPPTKCYCGTKSCRGYLEVDEEGDEHEFEPPTPVEKTGLSVPQVDAYRAALKDRKGGEWLINKRVKIWWSGNQRYFDADVLDYDSSKGVHTIHYLEDGQVSREILALNREQVRARYSPWIEMKEENLSGCLARPLSSDSSPENVPQESDVQDKKRRKSQDKESANDPNASPKDSNDTPEIIKPVWDWLWLDESRNDVTIAKKTDEELSHGELADDQPDSSNGVTINHPLESEQHQQRPISFARPALSPLVKIPAKLSYEVCREILQGISISVDHTDFRGAMKIFVEIMKTRFDTFIRQQLQENYFGVEMQVMLYGRAEKVEKIQKLIKDTADRIRFNKQSSLTSLHDQLLRNQPQIFTTDWRRKISIESMRLLSFLALTVGIKIPIDELYLNAFTTLSIAPNSSTSLTLGQQQQLVISEDAVLRTTRMSLISLCKTINATHRVELHALVLLQRCFDLLPSSSIGSDTLSLLAVCLLLSMKANGAFKPKHLSIVIIEAYPLIFNRKFPHDTATTNNSLPYYRNRILEMEKKIFKTLYCDVFVPDMTYLPIKRSVGMIGAPGGAGGGGAGMWAGLNCSNGNDSIQSDEIDLLKRVTTFLTTLLYRVGSKTIDITNPSAFTGMSSIPPRHSILCNEGLKVLPFDLIQWSCSLIACILRRFIQNYHEGSFKDPRIYLSSGYLPLDEGLLHHTIHSLAASPVFVMFYLNALSYYSPATAPGTTGVGPAGGGGGGGISSTHSIGLLWSVSLISHIIQCILSSSEIRSVGEMLYPSLSLDVNGLSASIKNASSNSLFGTQQQWKILVARVPFIYLRWIESWNLSQISLSPSSYNQPMKTRSLYLMSGMGKNGMEGISEDLSSVDTGEDHIGWIDGANSIIPIYIEDRVPIFVPNANPNDSNNAHDSRPQGSQKRKLEVQEDQLTSSSKGNSSDPTSAQIPSLPLHPPSSDGIVYCYCSPQELKRVNVHQPKLQHSSPRPHSPQAIQPQDSQQQSSPRPQGRNGSQGIPHPRTLVSPPSETLTPRLFAMIPSPSIKTQLRELKKYHQFNSPSSSSSSSSSSSMKYISSSYGLSSLCLSEVTMIQYLHYFALSDDLAMLGPDQRLKYYEGVGCPIAIVYDPQVTNQTHTGLYYNQLSSLKKGEHSHDLTNISTGTSSSPSVMKDVSPSLETPGPHEDDPDSILQLISTHRLNNSQESPQSSSSSPDGIRSSTTTAPILTSASSTSSFKSSASASSDLPSSSLLTYLYGLYPATECHIPLHSILSFLHHPNICSPWYLFDLSKQLIDIFHFCSRKGVLFKYIPYDHIYLNTRGRLVLHSLQGAVFISQDYGNSYPRNQSLKARSSLHSTSTTSPFGPYLSVTPPEVIYGAIPDQHSTIWSVMAVCYLLFTGLPPVKLSSMETKKYLQHLLALLGTPGTTKAMAAYYTSLPYAKEFGTHILDRQSGEYIEVKSRLEKILKLHLPPHLKACTRSLHLSQHHENSPYIYLPVQYNKLPEESSQLLDPLSDIFLSSLQLDPHKRPSFETLLQMPFYSQQDPSSSSSDHMIDIARILEVLRAQEESQIQSQSLTSEMTQEVWNEKLNKRKEIDDHLMSEIYGGEWKSIFREHRTLELEKIKREEEKASLKIEEEKRRLRLEKEEKIKRRIQEEEDEIQRQIREEEERKRQEDEERRRKHQEEEEERKRKDQEEEEERKRKRKHQEEEEERKRKDQEEEERNAAEEVTKKPRVMKDGKTTKKSFLPASIYRHPNSSLSEVIAPIVAPEPGLTSVASPLAQKMAVTKRIVTKFQTPTHVQSPDAKKKSTQASGNRGEKSRHSFPLSRPDTVVPVSSLSTQHQNPHRRHSYHGDPPHFIPAMTGKRGREA